MATDHIRLDWPLTWPEGLDPSPAAMQPLGTHGTTLLGAQGLWAEPDLCLGEAPASCGSLPSLGSLLSTTAVTCFHLK